MAAERGRSYVEKTCMRCHPGAQLDAFVERRVGDRELGAALSDFLLGHHAPDAGLRDDVIAYLRSRRGSEQKTE